jgi:hypothetical protein
VPNHNLPQQDLAKIFIQGISPDRKKLTEYWLTTDYPATLQAAIERSVAQQAKIDESKKRKASVLMVQQPIVAPVIAPAAPVFTAPPPPPSEVALLTQRVNAHDDRLKRVEDVSNNLQLMLTEIRAENKANSASMTAMQQQLQTMQQTLVMTHQAVQQPQQQQQQRQYNNQNQGGYGRRNQQGKKKFYGNKERFRDQFDAGAPNLPFWQNHAGPQPQQPAPQVQGQHGHQGGHQGNFNGAR